MVFKFTIDDVLNKYIPPNRTLRLPLFIRRFLGNHKVEPRSDYWIWLEIFLASFCGIILLEGVFKSNTVFTHHNAPIIIASYGATAILCFNAIQAPLAQPRSIIMGHFLSSLIGICIQKLFLLSAAGEKQLWLSGGLSVGVASVIMSICNCVHPPAGASALLPSIDEGIRSMSWWYLPAQLVSSVLIVSVALITGNIIRSYPVYWWTPAPIPQEHLKEPEPSESSIASEKEGITFVPTNSIEITTSGIMVPQNIDLTELEIEWLNTLQHAVKTLTD